MRCAVKGYPLQRVLARVMSRRTKVSIICGPLGAGKSSAILKLMQKHNDGSLEKGEKWALLVNEIGDVGIDGASLGNRGQGIAIREIAGGCICCAGGVTFRVALTQLIRRERPVRVLVEPSGLSRVSSLKGMLTAEPLAKGVELCATICLVPADMHEQLWGRSEQYVDQVYSADVLVLNRQDRVHDVSKVERFIRDIFPPKVVGLATHAEFDPALLEADPATPQEVGDDGLGGCTGPTRLDCGDGSTRLESTREGRRLVGWIFDAAGPQAWLFNRAKLEAGLAAFVVPPLDRAKAIFQTRGKGILLAHWGVAMPLILETVPAVQLIFFRDSDADTLGDKSSTLSTTAATNSFHQPPSPDIETDVVLDATESVHSLSFAPSNEPQVDAFVARFIAFLRQARFKGE